MSRWFIFRRLHSLAGLGLVLFLIEHLYINSQAAIAVHEGSSPYITAVNALQDLPLLTFLEVAFLGLPIFLHAILGIIYLKTGRYGFSPRDGSKPVTPYQNNYLYVLQRWTSWVLLVGIAIHVVQMRFLERPTERIRDGKTHYEVDIMPDAALYRLAQQLPLSISPVREENGFASVTVQTADFGTAELLIVRETFQSIGWMVLYTIFVLAACYHAFQGLWTFLLSWGVIISPHSQRIFHGICAILMCVVAALGLVAIYGTYWMHTG